MTDDQFRQLCNMYGFAPSRALRELIDCVRAQEIAACADELENKCGAYWAQMAAGIVRARKDKQ